MIPFKENIELTEFPVKMFISKSNKNNTIVVHPHWHNAIEILYVINGNAKQQFGENIVIIEKGDIIVIWGNQFHSTYSINDEICEILVLQFNTDIFLNSYVKSEIDEIRNLYFNNEINISSEIGKELYENIELIEEELKEKKDGYNFKVYGAIYNLIGSVLRNKSLLPIANEKGCSENDKLIANKIFDYIEKNYMEDISLSKISGVVGLSKTHFSRVFKNVSGMTFKKYLNYYRISKSIIHLENGDGVTETAMNCGFADINTFIRNFKKYKGSVPSKYKR